jgi:CheY-like chemotaxis protein
MVPPGFSLLVVDDSTENRDILARRLRRKGFRVLEAASGPAALELVGRETVDLVLLDIMMPGMNGLEVLRILRETRPAHDLPVVMATARSESEDMVVALELGANDYVTKPLDFPVVLARVQAQLRARRPPASEPRLDPKDIGPGTVLGGKYRLDTRLGSGSFGAVYRARHQDLETDVAVKVLQVGVSEGAEALARFRREGISACRVKHPNAVTILDFAIQGGVAYLVMELLEGHSLHEELSRHGVLAPGRAVGIALPVCDVLAEAHRMGIVHRDVKPSNIFLAGTPRGEVPKVLDFGIAKIAGDADRSLTQSGTILGTVAYMAPERFRGSPVDGKTDVYSLGVTLYQMLAGRTPFVTASKSPMALAALHVGESPRSLVEVAPGVSAALDAAVQQALRKEPSQRPTAEEFAANLLRAATAASPAGDRAAAALPGGLPSPSAATAVSVIGQPTEALEFTPLDDDDAAAKRSDEER